MIKWIVLLALLSPDARSQSSTPEALAIISKHIEAAGGLSAHQDLRSISRSGTIKFFIPNKTYSYNTYIIYPNMLLEELKTTKEILVSRGTNGKKFWSWDGKSYSFVEDLNLVEQMRQTSRVANRDVLWAEQELGFLKVVATPNWAKENKCLKGEKSEVLVCFDSESGLLTAKGTEQEYRLFSNWTKAGALSLPFSLIHYQKRQKVYQIELKSVRENKIINLEIFERPLHH